MKKFEKFVKEVNLSINQIIFFTTLIKGVVIFLAFFLIFSLFNFYPMAALIPSIGFFLLFFIKRVFAYKPKIIESKYDSLKEKLSAAVDNMDKENPVLNELEEEILRESKTVELSSFLRSKELSLNMLLSILLCFSILLSGIYSITLVDMGFLIKEQDIPSKIMDFLPGMVKGGAGEGAGIGEGGDIFGEPSLAILGEEDLDIIFNRPSYEVFTGAIEDAPDTEFEEIFPDEICADDPRGCVAPEAFKNTIPRDQQELVKNYFKNIVQS